MDTLETPITVPPRVSWHVADELRQSRTPRDRPPAGIRIVMGLIAFASLLSAAALLLSDRAPSVLTTLFGDRARRLWARIDASERIDLPSTTDIPPTDFLAHVGIWLIVTGLVGLTVWTWRGLAVSGALLSGLSMALELAQGRYATLRTVQATDAIANLIGVSLGVVTAAVCYLSWSAAASLVRAVSGHRR